MEIIDIGTGGGFPGVPLAIFFPDVKFHLADSIGKKLKIIEGQLRLGCKPKKCQRLKEQKAHFERMKQQYCSVQ